MLIVATSWWYLLYAYITSNNHFRGWGGNTAPLRTNHCAVSLLSREFRARMRSRGTIACSRDLGIRAIATRTTNLSKSSNNLFQYASNRLVRPTSIAITVICKPRLSTAPPCASAHAHNFSWRAQLQCADLCIKINAARGIHTLLYHYTLFRRLLCELEDWRALCRILSKARVSIDPRGLLNNSCRNQPC